ncbi:MAG: hypothetical protein Q9184_005966 [Pyrenodesmia sp. 2 TL-2023]
MLQERAEIQNTVVVRHWSFVELERLYEVALREEDGKRDQHRLEQPPPRPNGVDHSRPDSRLRIEGPKNDEDPSKALVRYNETPLHDLNDSLNRAMYRPNRLLHAPRNDIVDLLLDEWTRVRGTAKKKKHRGSKYRARFDTDDESSEIDFERSRDIGGRYIGPPPRKPRNVHFERAHVESGSEESDHRKPRHRGPRHAVLDSDSVSTSTTDSDSDVPPLQSSRRYGENGKGKASTQDLGDRDTRPTNSGSGGSPQTSRPDSRNGPPGPPLPRPMPMHNASWAGPAFPPQNIPGAAGLRPAVPFNIPPGPTRMSSNGPAVGMPSHQLPVPGLIPVSPGTSPNVSRGMYYPPPPNQAFPPGQRQPPKHSHHKSSRKRNGVDGKGNGNGNGERHTFKENAKRDVKRGIIGAGAVAGLMDIIEGLGAI